MVFEPALTRQDWLGFAAFALLILIAAGSGVVALAVAKRRSTRALASVAALCLLCGAGFAKLVTDRLGTFAEVEFTKHEAIVRGVAGTVRLPLTGSAKVDVQGDTVRLVSGGRSAVLPESAQWAVDNLVVDADYLANEFEGRSR